VKRIPISEEDLLREAGVKGERVESNTVVPEIRRRHEL